MNLLWSGGLVLLSLALGAAGGALTGMRIAGEFLGNGLAAMMGAMFGPASVVPAAVLGLTCLAWLR
jgi:hypothetical protein